MAAYALQKVVDNLIVSGVFSCSSCKNLLVCPVRLVKNVGNICNPCYQRVKEFNLVETIANTALDKILKTLELPCIYQVEGCDERFSYDDLQCHKSNCTYRSIRCIFATECKWNSRIKDFINHFNDDHTENIVASNNDVFNVSIKQDNDDIISMLKTSSGTFISRTKVSPDNLKFIIYDLGDVPKTLKYSFCIECVGNRRRVEIECNVVSDIKAFQKFDESVSTELKVEPLSLIILSDGNLKLNITFNVQDGSSKMKESMLHLLECQICKIYMKPPIYQCTRGHDICNLCRSKVSVCPTCNQEYGVTRNYTLESLVSQIRYPCSYEDQGCKIKSLVAANHESVCPFRPWYCPMDGCTFSSYYSKLISHFRSTHASKCILENVFVTLTSQKMRTSIHYFLLYEQLFELVYTNAYNACSWNVFIIGPKKLYFNYVFEIEIKLCKRGTVRNITFGGLCDYKDKDSKVSNAIKFNEEIMKQFVDDHVSFVYSIRIMRKKLL